MSDNEDDKLGKDRRRHRAVKGRNNGGGFVFPRAIVLSPAEAASQPGAIEAGLVLVFLVGLLFFYGFYEAVESLPDVPRAPNWKNHMGENLNLALNQFESGYNIRSKRRKVLDAGENGAASEGGSYKITSVDEVTVPECKWPVHLSKEIDNYDTIIHPGDLKTKMKVPPFWSPPLHKNGLISRELAMKIGSCIEPDPNGNHARGDSCPISQRTIFVQIASYRDFECRGTVEEVFGMATHPERIRVAVVDQIVNGEDPRCDEPHEPCDVKPEQSLCKYKDQIEVYEMAAELSIGPVFARHIGYRMYRGEYYATQSDAHVSFTVGWDMDIISQLEATNDEMGVLTTYLTDVQGSIDKNGHSLVKTRPIMCNTIWEGGVQGMHLRHASQPEAFPVIHGEPQLSPWWAAGYSFSRGHFVTNVPYDWLSPMIFQGEEMSIGIRGFTIGYDYYAPERSVCFHHYAVGKNSRRNKVHHFWENGSKYDGMGRKAMQRLLGIVRMNPEVDPKAWDHTDEDIYGLGGVRPVEKFYETFGIDVRKKTIEKHMCRFVDGKAETSMHRLFHKHLRKDGMGVDYTNIQFRFVDPERKNKDELDRLQNKMLAMQKLVEQGLPNKVVVAKVQDGKGEGSAENVEGESEEGTDEEQGENEEGVEEEQASGDTGGGDEAEEEDDGDNGKQ